MPKYTRERVIEKVLKGESLKGKNLRDLDLSGANLVCADFSGADLSWTNFTGTNFKGTEISLAIQSGVEADLVSVYFSQATLTGTDFRNAKLIFAEFTEANINEAEFFRATLISANFTKACLVGTSFSSATLIMANFTGARLDRVLFNNANLANVDFSDANFKGTTLTGARMGSVNLTNANLVRAELEGVDLYKANLEGVNLTSANLYSARMFMVNLKNANLTCSTLISADFENANLMGADISGANIYHIKTPNWNIKDIKCTHVYCYPNGADEETKEKSRRNFREGEFEAIYKSIPTIDICFGEEFSTIDNLRLIDIHEKMRLEMPEAGVILKKMERFGNDMVVTLGVENNAQVLDVTNRVEELFNDKEFAKEFLLKFGVDALKVLCPSSPHNTLADASSNITINNFTQPSSYIATSGEGHTVINGSRIDRSAIGAGASVDFSQRYEENRVAIDKGLAELGRVIGEGQWQLVEDFTEALKGKDDTETHKAWGMIQKVPEVVTAGTAAYKVAKVVGNYFGVSLP